tara:strand:- start:451 stop:1065 length:615 start_codon:yes stop_codon:yes gene_type:complete
MTNTAARSRPSDMVFWIAIGAVIVALVAGVILSRRFGSDPAITVSPLIGRPLSEFSMAYLDQPGSLVSSDLEGDIVVVNFWASWCFSCRVEHDALLSIADTYAPFGVTFVGINYQDISESHAVSFLDELGRSVSTHYVKDEGSRIALEFGVLGLPETFFIDRRGVVVGKVSGPVNTALLVDTIDQILLGELVGQMTTGEVENRE